ncbi:MAG: hydroxymethylglutaryl-CoA reductase, degradative [Deltaproteobacteria bacterium]|nr:hydroxymethylglutaryl-CoA reductase, degradative [Deltaproteobacteria bacterium]
MTDSSLPGFYRLSLRERQTLVARARKLTPEDVAALTREAGLSVEQADKMVENALGVLGVPIGLCANLRVDHRDWLVPMAVEEPSVVAAASHAAKLLRGGGGIMSEVSAPLMIGQVQLLDVADFDAAAAAISEAREELIERANANHPYLVGAGGGARDVELRRLDPLDDDDPVGMMAVVHLLVDVRDAMGANSINAMCEVLAPRFEELSGGRARLRILSNLTDRRTVRVVGRVPLAELAGKGCESPEELARGIEEASVFAERDPYRAATHNKGIMNGVDAVLLAFGQDWRAVEAGAHAYAARGGRYTALACWRVRGAELVGEMVLPLAVGVVGGVARVHPTVQVNRKIAGVVSAAELASLTAAVGLAQNLGALRALAAEGIQHGHMRLHARNIASEAGAVGGEVDAVAEIIAEGQTTNVDAARKVLRRLRHEAA